SKIHNKLTVGSFIGMEYLFYPIKSFGTWRAISHVTVQKVSINLMGAFFEKNGIYHETKQLYDEITSLQRNVLFSQECSVSTLNNIVKVMKSSILKKGALTKTKKSNSLILIDSGKLQVIGSHGEIIEEIGAGNFFGEHTFFSFDFDMFNLVAEEESEILCIENDIIKNIPIVQWKMLEVFAKRRKILETLQSED
ncbi:MAG: cyclic nucleotide-binding domain-containing protein, partial [Nitrospinae bacterium]|nr:cyclic nucleotide-binding domain-containing protein [Nitrospinota bacterium]